MTVDDFNAEVEKWIATAKDGLRPYTELTYQPMQEVLSYLRANGNASSPSKALRECPIWVKSRPLDT